MNPEATSPPVTDAAPATLAEPSALHEEATGRPPFALSEVEGRARPTRFDCAQHERESGA